MARRLLLALSLLSSVGCATVRPPLGNLSFRNITVIDQRDGHQSGACYEPTWIQKPDKTWIITCQIRNIPAATSGPASYSHTLPQDNNEEDEDD